MAAPLPFETSFRPPAEPLAEPLFHDGDVELLHLRSPLTGRPARPRVRDKARMQLVFVRSGSFPLLCAGGVSLADSNVAVLLQAGEVHEAAPAARSLDLLVLRAPLTCCGLDHGPRAMGWRGRRLPVMLPVAAGALLEMHRIAAAARAGAAAHHELRHRLLGVGAAVLSALPEPRPVSAVDASRPGRLVERVRELLSAHLADGISLAALGREVHTSPFHLARRFRTVTGVTIHRYLLQLRLRHALARLADGEPAIAALALDVGFADHAHLTSTMRRVLGVTPSGFRAEMRPRASADATYSSRCSAAGGRRL